MNKFEKTWRAQAPSNIALIKYMGKTQTAGNRPTNSSLSYTLPFLRTIVEIQISNEKTDRWERLREFEGRLLEPIELTETGQAKFLAHFKKLKDRFSIKENFLIRSANDFASDCGLASSASSFAALTKVALEAFCDLTDRKLPTAIEAAELSREGSGSSCRSFFSPWSVWKGDLNSGLSTTFATESMCTGVDELKSVQFLHQAVVVSADRKTVSSSEAHQRVKTSALFKGRPERAENRLGQLVQAMVAKNWRSVFEISWAEFWDMHALFESSEPSFGYMTAETLSVLRKVRALTWDVGVRGPIMTMDAGPNVHLLHVDDDAGRDFAREVVKLFDGQNGMRVLTSGEFGL